MPIATIIGAIVAAGATIAGGVMTTRAQREANEKNLELANITRSDTLEQQETQNKIQQEQLKLSKQQVEFNQQEAELNREERAEERGYNRMQNAANRYATYLNNKTALQNQRLSPLIGG